MSDSRRKKRMFGVAGRKPTSLSLTSLMDVFTILVFFLLVNSSSDAVIENPKDFKLPSSISDTNPGNSVELMIGVSDILVQGEFVMSIDQMRGSESEDNVVQAISDELSRRQQQARLLLIGEPDEEALKKLRELTVIANKEVSYDDIRKIMASASNAGYTNFSMAVLQKSANQ